MEGSPEYWSQGFHNTLVLQTVKHACPVYVEAEFFKMIGNFAFKINEQSVNS